MRSLELGPALPENSSRSGMCGRRAHRDHRIDRSAAARAETGGGVDGPVDRSSKRATIRRKMPPRKSHSRDPRGSIEIGAR